MIVMRPCRARFAKPGGLALLMAGSAALWPLVVAAAEPPPETATAPVPAETFDLLAFRVDGNQVLDETAVEKAVYPFLGPGKGVDAVEQARQALEQAFHAAGYDTVFVDIPEQDVVDGLVILQVNPARVERLRVTGSRYFSLGRIKARVPELAEGGVPHMPTVQTQLAELAKQSPDLKVTPVIRAGSTPGRLEVDLQVDDRLPLHGGVELNSRSSANTDYTRLSANLRYDNLWQRFHSASLQYLVSPENSDQVEVWSGTYALPTGWADSRLALYGVGISSATGVGSVGALSVVGSGAIYGLRLVLPLGGHAGFFHSATLGLDYKNFGQSLQVTGADSLATPIHYLPFLAEYDAHWQGEQSTTSASLGLHVSLRGVGNDPAEFANKRYLASAGYAYVSADLSHVRELPGDIRLAARLLGQYTDAPLISNEQFAAGGPGGPARVRGYHQTELLGDQGVSGSLELYSPGLALGDGNGEVLRGLLFAEGASLWTQHALSGTPPVAYLAGTGAGLRLRLWKSLAGEFDWGYPLVATPLVRAGAQRVDFRLAYDF